tara:strand:+ start:619 stop:741 length:123 start_codon:yes stop_codon:yes gene_type:complete
MEEKVDTSEMEAKLSELNQTMRQLLTEVSTLSSLLSRTLE